MAAPAPAPAGLTAPLTLLVDRDVDTRRMYAEFLKLSACSIEEAEDGREALAKALTACPDVIVTETRLPGMDGYELCRLLRADPATHDIPIVFVTSAALEGEVRRAALVGADAVLFKPCLPETLYSEMIRLLRDPADLREHARAARVNSDGPEQRLATSRAHTRRMTLSRAHVRQQTAAPPSPPPSLMCPSCDHTLSYTNSHIGGVNARTAEQWDYYECPRGCGIFQYRQRTRKLRRVT